MMPLAAGARQTQHLFIVGLCGPHSSTGAHFKPKRLPTINRRVVTADLNLQIAATLVCFSRPCGRVRSTGDDLREGDFCASLFDLAVNRQDCDYAAPNAKGDHRFCRDGVSELGIDIGAGYRDYFATAVARKNWCLDALHAKRKPQG